jgi:hypothetical protein
MEAHSPAPWSHEKSPLELMVDLFVSPDSVMTHQVATPTSEICFITAVVFQSYAQLYRDVIAKKLEH